METNNGATIPKDWKGLLTILDALDEPAYIADPVTYELLFVNRLTIALIGEPNGRRCFEYLQGSHSPCPFCTNERLLADPGSTIAWEAQNRINGRWYKCIDRLLAIDGKRLARVEVAIDVTERRIVEDEREKLLQQLLKSQRGEVVGRLIAGITHDFNNMLSVVLGHTQSALENQGSLSEMCSHLSGIREIAMRSVGLARQLIDFARGNTGTPVPIRLSQPIAANLPVIKRLIGERIEMKAAIPSSIWQVCIDPVQFDQILLNLCVNARDSIVGNGRITIEAQNVVLKVPPAGAKGFPCEGEYVMMRVSDTGSGIPESFRERIFEPYFSTKDPGKGTGLGLPIVLGILERRQGSVRARSNPSGGTIFEVFLPRDSADAPHQAPVDTSLIPGGNEAILLVEDDLELLNLFSRTLEKAGYRVLAFSDPQKAVTAVELGSHRIQLLISVLVMPGMNGIVLVDRLQKPLAGVPRLFISGYPVESLQEERLFPQGDDFLRKPFPMTDLLLKVREILDKQSLTQMHHE